jgi:hypothetical protein
MSFDRTLLHSFVGGALGFMSDTEEKVLPEYLPPEILHRYFCMALFWGLEDDEDLIPRLVFGAGFNFPVVKLADESGRGGSYGLTFIPAASPREAGGYSRLLNPKFFKLKNGMLLILDDMIQIVAPGWSPKRALQYLTEVADKVEKIAQAQGLFDGNERKFGSLE